MVPAHFTLRTRQTSDLELIGGEDCYMPVCRECFMEKTNEQKREQERMRQLEESNGLKSPDGTVMKFTENHDEDSLVSKERGQRPTLQNSTNSPCQSSTNSSPEPKQEWIQP